MKIIKGIPGAPGIVSGKVIFFEKSAGTKKSADINEAIEKSLEKVRRLAKKTLNDLGEEQAKIFSAYEMLLEDCTLTDPIKSAIDSGTQPKDAVTSVTESVAAILSGKGNEYMRQRADDIRYIGQMLIDMLDGNDTEFSFPDDGEKYIVAAHELTPVDTMLFDKNQLAGLVTELGGATSHTVILAKSLGIPAVIGAADLKQADGLNAYLDGYGGVLAVNPGGAEKARYEKLLSDELALNEKLEQIKSAEAKTKDGERIAVCINIGKPSDLKGSEDQKFDGVGLYRSEFLYSSSDKKPTLSQQREAYKKVIDAVYPNPVTIRTIDVGGDKQLSYLNMKPEENPFLGSRGIRLCLNNPEIFAEQLEAILTSCEDKAVKVMLPMITSAVEIRKARKILEDVKKQLDEKNTPYCRRVFLGIMIETPASAVMADSLAKECDFFSIGTNDLVQYITAADRGNAEVESIYNPCNPAVIRMINHVIQAGAQNGIEVSVCGDLAANTDFTELLLGMGLKKFSVPLPMVSRIKHKIAETELKSAKVTAQKALKANDENEVLKILRKG